MTMSNKSMFVGMIAGIGIAAAGGVAAYTFLEHRSDVAVETPQDANVKVAHASTASHAAAAPAQDCWDEQVTTQKAQTDPHAIAGTATGAVVGGAIGKDVGDHDITTAAGAAAGAYIGRKIQQHIQEKNADARTETHVEHRCAPAGTPH
jgi:uncharacterized protein YcfJ